MKYTLTQLSWMQEVADGEPLSDKQRRALFILGRYIVSPHWLLGQTRAGAEQSLNNSMPEFRDAYQRALVEDRGEPGGDTYGSIILIWLAMVLIGAVLSWAIKRLLDWLFPDTPTSINRARLNELTKLQELWRAGR